MATRLEEERGLPSIALALGFIAVKELQRIEDKIAVLDRLGYGTKEIATICGTNPATIRTLRSKRKKAKRGKR